MVAPAKDTYRQSARPDRHRVSPPTFCPGGDARRGGGGGAEPRGSHPDRELGVELDLLVGFNYMSRSVNFFQWVYKGCH